MTQEKDAKEKKGKKSRRIRKRQWIHDKVEVEGEMSFRGPRMLNILPCDPCIMDLV